MPRDGTGKSDNAIEKTNDIIHGAGDAGSNVDRSGKAAPMPEGEKGAAIVGMNASGGQSQGLSQGPNRGQGKGPKDP